MYKSLQAAAFVMSATTLACIGDLTLADHHAPKENAAASESKTLSLFNGKDLTGWEADVPKADDNPNIDPSFIVRDGKLVSLGDPRGTLISKESFSDYRLIVEYRFAGKPGNCGVLAHVSNRRQYGLHPQSLEVQLQSGSAGDFWCIHENITVPNMADRRNGPPEKWGGKRGESRHIRNLTDGSENEPGKWNQMVVETLGDKIRVWVNGDLVNDGYDCTAKAGQIGLQAEGSEVEFRRLDLSPIEQLTPTDEKPEGTGNPESE